MKVYISSTYKDLVECRHVVYRVVRMMGYDSIAMEDYVADDDRPLDKCLKDVKTSDLFIGIIAWRYGTVVSNKTGLRKSITQWEYEAAASSGVPRLLFILDSGAAWPPFHVDHFTGENGKGRLIDKFRKTLQKEKTISLFRNCTDLSNLVSISIHKVISSTEAEKQITPIKIFLADDSEVTIASWQRMLSRDKSFDVVGTSAEAARLYESVTGTTADVLLLDLRWNGDDKFGQRLIKRIKRKTPQLKIIAITAFERLLSNATLAGADAVLTKTFTSSQLKELIKNITYDKT